MNAITGAINGLVFSLCAVMALGYAFWAVADLVARLLP